MYKNLPVCTVLRNHVMCNLLFFCFFIQSPSDSGNKGKVKDVKLELHGTLEMPDHVAKAPNHRRRYNLQYNDVQNIRVSPIANICIFKYSF